jgi:hypothetical protein
LTFSKRDLLGRRLKALAKDIDTSRVTLVDIVAALPTEMNLLACRLDRRLKRPSTKEIKAARQKLSNRYGIPLKLAKAIINASLCGSPIGLRSSVWEEYDVDDQTKRAIAASEEIKRNRAIFEQNFKLFDSKGYFDFITDRQSKTKSQLYSLLYCQLEKARMMPLHLYLESQGIVFVAKHDGVDIYSNLSEEQKNAIRKIIGIECSIETLCNEGEIRSTSNDLYKTMREVVSYYDVVSEIAVTSVRMALCKALRNSIAESPP